MRDGEVDVLAPRFLPLCRRAPFGWDSTGDRTAQADGVRALRDRERGRAAAAGCVAAAGAVVLALCLLPGPADRTAVLVALSAGAAGGLLCRARCRAAGARLRRADETVGFPVPRDLVAGLRAAAEPLLALHCWYALPEDGLDPLARRVLRAHERALWEVDTRMFADLHRGRAAWVAGDAAGWRRHTEGAVHTARRAHAVYADVRSRTALPPPDGAPDG